MTQIEIKTLLHESIENINDEDFLLSIKNLVERKYIPPTPLKLSAWQVEKLDNAKKEIEEGKYLSDTEADKIVDEWLSK
ncbi:MAG: hypothetical protein KAT34_02290 [Candidatus Aminicenantes bacterium]|jgi:hypothetical protein|nr:hypothetical protein [Candidatus Aminicenantes bacterium]